MATFFCPQMKVAFVEWLQASCAHDRLGQFVLVPVHGTDAAKQKKKLTN